MKPHSLNLAKQCHKLNFNVYSILLLIYLHKRCNLVTAFNNQELNDYDQQKSSDESRINDCKIANYASICYSASYCNADEFLVGYFKTFPTSPENQETGSTKNLKTTQTKYLLYDVNVAEGFNLRRDVYIRIAKLVKLLNSQSATVKWKLVLPPWSDLFHWTNRYLTQKRLKWSEFFDTESLGYYVPVIELEQFLELTNRRHIDLVYYLRNYENLEEGQWTEKADVRDCNQIDSYYKQKNGKFRGNFWSYSKFYASQVRCVSFQGTLAFMAQHILNTSYFSTVQAFMIDRAETILYDSFGDSDYWKCRRSMRFATKLVKKSKELRAVLLNSDDENDRTKISPDWRETRKQHASAIGGPYLAVHLRRGDFLYSRDSNIVSLHRVAEQIRAELLRLNLTTVYLATDGSLDEIQELKSDLGDYELVFYKPTDLAELYEFKDGGVAIIDQLVCAHARYFVGTYESTFSLRIQEEREILGFDPETTFNILCAENNSGKKKQCKSTRWLVKYDNNDDYF